MDPAALAHDAPQASLLPYSEAYHDGDEKPAVPASTRARDKIRCLDGLRGIACLIVFNYHFFWPWTPLIMLGWGAMPPATPEPYTQWTSLPIICLLHRGRPMVAIFFAISGYVLCRHIQRAIHERRLDAVYQSLASAVFRRAFRLYIPPTISMFIVAMAAQMGVFRSEQDIYTGPDSRFINGTVTVARLNSANTPCLNGTFAVEGADGIAKFLGLQSSLYLGNITQWNETVCLNATSRNIGPSNVYRVSNHPRDSENVNLTSQLEGMAPFPGWAEYYNPAVIVITNTTEEGDSAAADKKNPKPKPKKPVVHKETATWVQYGGSWEEHPFIHDNMTYALKNYTRAYAEWANPFNFGHYHPRYDPHTFTIPMELRGSMCLYLFLLATASLKARFRLTFAAVFSAYSLTLGRWDMATFLAGMLFSEMDIRSAADRASMPAGTQSLGALRSRPRLARLMRWSGITLALYFLSYPDAGAEYTPGFKYLSSWVPRYYHPLSGWMFYQAMGAMLLLYCVLRSPSLRKHLEGKVPQYLGKVSFSLYLVHGPVLHSLGFWIMPRLFESFGRNAAYLIGYVVLLSVSMGLTHYWHRKVDGWSVTVGKRVEKMLTEV